MYGRESNYPPPSTRHPRGRARKGALLFLEGGEIGSFTLGSCSCRRLIADESANDSIITAKLWRQVSLEKKRRGKVERRLIFRMQMAGIIHILRQDDTASSSMDDGFFSPSPLSRREKRQVYSQSFHASFLPPFAGERGRKREEDSRLTLSAPL